MRMSKRTGKAISLTDLLDEIPVDACRYFFNAKPETQMEFDLLFRGHGLFRNQACSGLLSDLLTGWSRPKGSVVCGTGVFLLALTTALGFSVFHFQPFAEGTTWLDFWDFIVSNNILPLGSLILALFCCNKFGWGWDNFIKESNTGKGLKVQSWMKLLFRFVLPIIIAFIYIYGMFTFNWK